MIKVSRPLGARVIVKEIITTLSLEARGAKLNIKVITHDNNRPRSTQGRVIALGTDPFLRDNGLEEGCIVTFAPHAGIRIFIEDEEFRSLEFQELIMITTEEKDEKSSTVDVDVSTANDGPRETDTRYTPGPGEGDPSSKG